MSFESAIIVPNEGPKNAKIYIVGEAPGAEEIADKRPFVGVSGILLRNCLRRHGITEASARFTNLCQRRPKGNIFASVISTRDVEAGVEEIASDLREFKPNIVIGLGNWPLWFLCKRSGKKGAGTGIGKWRGSFLKCILPGCEEIKVIPTFHPAYIVRNYDEYPIFDHDLQRAEKDSTFPELNYPEYKFIIDPRGDELLFWTEQLCNSEYLACDIESVKSSTHILCHGFAPDEKTAVVIPHSSTDFQRVSALTEIYQSQAKKIFHNGGVFDIPMLALNNFEVKNYYWDTMVAQHVMWGELPKSLDFLTSVYTRQPYYKTSGRAEIPEDTKAWDQKFDRKALYEYNGKDCCVTYKCFIEMEEELTSNKDWKSTFAFEMASLGPAQRISFTGLLIDEERRNLIRRALEAKWAILQLVLDNLTGFKTNVNSPKAIGMILYDKDKFALPPRRNYKGGVTTDEDAIVSLLAFCKDKLARMKQGGSGYGYWDKRFQALQIILIIRGIRKLLSSYINNKISADQRVRSSYTPTGTKFGRWSASLFFDRTGANSQTFPREILEIQDYSAFPILKELLPHIFNQQKEDIDAANEEDNREDSSS